MSDNFRDISRAMAKAAASKLRGTVLPVSGNYLARMAVCRQCPKLVVRNGVSYCGTPFLLRVRREPYKDGCGCPTLEKSKSPSEHCPIDAKGMPAIRSATACSCKWCQAGGTRRK